MQEHITRQVRDAVNQLIAAKLALPAANTSYDLTKKLLAADQRKYELGAEDNFFVLNAQERLAEADLALLQAQVNYQVALAAIRHATSDLLDPYQLQIEAASK